MKLQLPLLALLLLSGCQQYVDFINSPDARANLALDVQTAVVTRITLEGGGTAQGMAKEANRTIRIATKIKEAAERDITAGDVRSLLVKLAISRVDEEDRPRVRFIVDILYLQLKRRFKLDLTVVGADTLPLTRSLVIELCDASIEAATPYTQ